MRLLVASPQFKYTVSAYTCVVQGSSRSKVGRTNDMITCHTLIENHVMLHVSTEHAVHLHMDKSVDGCLFFEHVKDDECAHANNSQ